MTDSLQAKLIRSLVAGLAVLLLLQAIAVWFGIRQVTERYLATRLEHEIETLLATVELSADGTPRLAGRALAGVYDQPFSGHYYEIAAAGGTLRSRSLWDQVLGTGTLTPGERTLDHRRGPQDQPLLVMRRGFRKQGHALTVTAAEDLSQITRDTRLFQIGYAVLTALVLASLVAWQSSAVRRALLPLSRAARSLRDLRHGERRTLSENVPREIRPLVREINRLQEITATRLDRSRTAIGNLAHALKTPLTVLGRLASDPGVRKLPGIPQEIETQVDSARRLIDRELSRAQLAGAGPVTSPFRPQEDISSLAETMRRIYPQLSIREYTASATTHTSLDRQDILELLGNVLDNACKWAQKQANVTATSEDAELRVAIEDDGPGASEEMRDVLARRGTRLDESKPGHGLGLAIAAEIVSGYGGRLAFGHSAALGGLRVDITLPAEGDVRPGGGPSDAAPAPP